MLLVHPKRFQELQDRLNALEQQIRVDRKTVHSCKISAKWEDDTLEFQADYTFSTEQPRMLVFLGLQGAFLTQDAELNQESAPIELMEDGYYVRVRNEGNQHRLTLHAKAPVGLKRSATGTDRSVSLGLPGAAITNVSLDLPGGVRELQYNDVFERQKKAGSWQLSLGKAKSLALTWKEPISMAGGPMLNSDAEITVRLEDSHVETTAVMQLADSRGQAREWPMWLPVNANVVVQPPPGLKFDWVAKEDQPGLFYYLKPSEPNQATWGQSPQFTANPGPRLGGENSPLVPT